MGERTQAGYLARGNADLSVVVLHESYGLFSPLSNVPEVCDRLAAAGFQSLAPDLYDGGTAATVDESLHLMAELQETDALASVRKAAKDLLDKGAGRLAVLGFCMGGVLSFISAVELDEFAGAVVFYGTPRRPPQLLKIPVLGHYALHDAFVSLDEIRRIESELVKAEKQFAFWYYDGEHGFMNNKIMAYSPTNEGLAWERTLAFLHRIGRST
jgi:carboxymethylenebutenolidase